MTSNIETVIWKIIQKQREIVYFLAPETSDKQHVRPGVEVVFIQLFLPAFVSFVPFLVFSPPLRLFYPAFVVCRACLCAVDTLGIVLTLYIIRSAIV